MANMHSSSPPVTLLAERRTSRRGIVINGLIYDSPALVAALPVPGTMVRVRFDPANLDTITVILEKSATELIVPVTAVVKSVKRSSGTVRPHGLGVSA